MNLDPRQTAALLAVVETGSFEQAAVRLRITASAVSQRVRALETQLGHPLVIRSRPCEATRVGQRLLQYLRRADALETDLVDELMGRKDVLLPVKIAANADTMATWFFPALSQVLLAERVLLDVAIADQDHTYSLLETGQAIGCVSTESRPMRGCTADLLGTMRYRLVAAKRFRERWFAAGLSREAARQAPVLAYSSRDALQSRFLEKRLGLLPGTYPCHYVAMPEPRLTAILNGLGYGMVPELQMGNALTTGKLVDLAPDHPTDVKLYWHTWKVQSPRMDLLCRHIVEQGRKALAA